MDFIMLQLFVIALLATTCLGLKKKNDRHHPFRYITNWLDYGMPKKIKTDILQDIQLKIAAYKRAEYCPFGPTYDDCKSVSVRSVLSAIMNTALGRNIKPEKHLAALRIKHHSKTYADTSEEADFNEKGSDLDKVTLVMALSKNRQKLRSPKKQHKCQCEEEQPEKLAMSRYKFLKVNPSFQNRETFNRNKVFGKIIE